MPLQDVVEDASSLLASRNRLKTVGARLASGGLADDDLDALEAMRLAYHVANTELKAALSQAGIDSVQRLKNLETIREKITRNKTDLSRMRDIAGTRIVVGDSRSEQDQVVQMVVSVLAPFKSTVIDRRVDPRQGYRAVHIEAQLSRIPVEIQVRTRFQHLWAETFEKIGDVCGRDIRYGGVPDLRGFPSSAEGVVATLLENMQMAADVIDQYEELRRQLVYKDGAERAAAQLGLDDVAEVLGSTLERVRLTARSLESIQRSLR